MMIFGLWKIKSRSVSYKCIEDKAIRFAKKHVCGIAYGLNFLGDMKRQKKI